METQRFGHLASALLSRRAIPEGARLAPMPKTSGPLGHVGNMRRDALRFFLESRNQFGDVVRLRLGPMTAHLVAHPEHVRHVVQEGHRIYTKNTRGYEKMKLILGLGLLTSDGEFWLRQRRIAQPAFHRERIEAFAGAMVRAADDMLDSWAPYAERGEALDVHVEMNRVALRIVSETLLGRDVSSEATVIGRALAYVLEDINDRIQSMWDLPLAVPTRRNRLFRQHRAALDRVVREMIEERRKRDSAGTDLLGLLMDSRDEETGERMTDEQLRDEVMTMFLAGHETTANGLAWTLYLLSKNPHAARRLREEVDTVLGDRAPAIADLPKLQWTSMVIKEGLRLYPPAWLIARSPSDDDEIGGYFVPKGSLVFVSPYVTHRHPEVWEDPEGFDPERFAPEREAQLPRFAYFPFAGGPRQCIGNRFAMVEAQLVMARIAQRYRLDLVPGHPVIPEPTVTLRPREGLAMTPYAR